jgi:primase-polymerase (primpol)-like protein
MRGYICSFDGNEVDLDDENTYSHLPNTIKELDNLMFKEIGYAHCYMYYFHPSVFRDRIQQHQNGQLKRVAKPFTRK